jgi:putative glutamine amidotransferase
MASIVPRVGLTTYRERAAFGVWDEVADLLPASYAIAIQDAGALPVLLPPAAGVDGVDRMADVALGGVDGVVLSGGADVDPGCYGSPRAAETGPPDSHRDSWEIALVEAALQRDLPLLAVCRGMQVLTVALGGSLVQHLPNLVGSDMHRPTLGRHGRHLVRLAPGSRLAGWLGEEAEVATYHHQAVDRLPGRVAANGWAADGTIEAVEVCDATWAIGVQWHPEVHDGHGLFAAFVAACAEHATGAVTGG